MDEDENNFVTDRDRIFIADAAGTILVLPGRPREDNKSNARTPSDRRRPRNKPWNQYQEQLNGLTLPDNVAQYCPSVSTISIVDSDDEEILPYALKRIQRDFPSNWRHHPLGSSHDEIDWHQHRLRSYNKSFRDKQEPSVTMSLPGRVRSTLKESAPSIQDEQAPHRKVRWDDDPRVANIRPSQRGGNKERVHTPLYGVDPHGNSRLAPPPADDSDREEERRRLKKGAHVMGPYKASRYQTPYAFGD